MSIALSSINFPVAVSLLCSRFWVAKLVSIWIDVKSWCSCVKNLIIPLESRCFACEMYSKFLAVFSVVCCPWSKVDSYFWLFLYIEYRNSYYTSPWGSIMLFVKQILIQGLIPPLCNLRGLKTASRHQYLSSFGIIALSLPLISGSFLSLDGREICSLFSTKNHWKKT